MLDVAAWENASVTRVEVAVGGGGPAVRAAAELAVVQTAACNAGLDQTEFLVVQARLVNGGGDQEALRRGGGNQVVVVLPGEEDERGGARVRWQEARARQPLEVDWAREAATPSRNEVSLRFLRSLASCDSRLADGSDRESETGLTQTRKCK